MKEPAPPKAVAVDVVAARPTRADKALVARLESDEDKSLPGLTYIVKVRLRAVPEPTSHGWALYVDDVRIPKYWEYQDGIYFKVFDPQFFADHTGGKLRFSEDGTRFTDTGLKLPALPGPRKSAKRTTATLPSQEGLVEPVSAPRGRVPAPRSRRRPGSRRRS